MKHHVIAVRVCFGLSIYWQELRFRFSDKCMDFSFTAFKCWCQAAWQYSKDFPSDPLFDNDVV